jgi:crotonobetainyl-CoA:carnitine CoA-transferase CaiB-like acyl-CoA transferase
MAALQDIRVIDLSTSVAGVWCSRMLADFGADVVMVEPPGGHPVRALAPFTPDGLSIPARYFLVNKRSVVLDVDDAGQRDAIRRLASEADVVVSSARPGELVARGLRYADFGRPGLVMAHVTPYGMSGELAETPGNDLTVSALSGWASINGMADREPLQSSGWQSSYCTGTAAYAAVLAALHHRETHPGEGQEVDIAERDVMAATFAPAMLGAEYSGEDRGRRRELDMTGGPVPVADGHFSLTISRAHFWRDAMTLLGLPDLAEDSRWEASHYRQAHKADYVRRVEAKMAEWKKMDLFHELAARRVIAGPVLEMADLVDNEQLLARGFWTELPDDGSKFPGAPFKMSGTPWALRAPEVAK